VDPALYAQVKAVALRFCRQVADEALPWEEALGELRQEIATEPVVGRQGELQAVELVLGVVADCAALGAHLPRLPTPAVTVAEPAKGPVVALPGGLRG